MDRRSWPWKKKSSDKAAAEKVAAASESVGSQGDQAKQDNYKKPNYVQISVESYTHLTGLEDQVKSYEDQMKTMDDEIMELNEKLSAANSEITTKENLVKQHTKVAEEAVSGWEKAEAEAAALKNHLESVTLLKLTAEDRASHLDGALKECMRQIRNLKEEHEQNLREVILAKTKQWDKIKLELDSKIANLDQELLRSAAENAALSRSLQERSNMLIQMSEEKSQAKAEIELLKGKIESCDKEVNSLKYELHIVAKELEIRNEEKNMSVRSAEVANKQHLEGVKKIAKLEAECQRLRGLVRKKLPGPAALAQMKLEVESLGRDYGETRLRRSSGKPSSPHQSSLHDFSLETVQKYHKDYELLTERLLAMEEETKMLKEALAKRNNELQASRNLCAKTLSKLQCLEAQQQSNGDHRSPPKSNLQIQTEGSFSQNASNPPSLTSMSEDGNDDEGSCTGSWATALVAELSHLKKEKSIESPANHLELMDDFLEMEKLACLSNDGNGAIPSSDVSCHRKSESVNQDMMVENSSEVQSEVQHELDPPQNLASPKLEIHALNSKSDADLLSFSEIQTRISMVFESISKDSGINTVLEDIRCLVQDMQKNGHQLSARSVEATHFADGTCQTQACPEVAETTLQKLSLPCKCKPGELMSQEIVAAISQIHDFVLFLGKEAQDVQSLSHDGDGFNKNLEQLSATFEDIVDQKKSLVDFVLDLSPVLVKACGLQFNIVGYRNNDSENGSYDCIDKVALADNKVVQESLGQLYSNGCTHFSDLPSDPDIPHEGSLVPSIDAAATSWKCSLEEFEQLKSEKDKMAEVLARCTETLETTQSQLQETEQLLAEVKSQLTSAQKSNSLAETQVKCLAESYKSLEIREGELQTEVNLLRVKIENLENELQEEKKSHQDSLARCKDLQEQLQRIESCPAADPDARSNQEKELAAAAEKLAECQETIYLLGRQLNSLCPQTEYKGSPYSEQSRRKSGCAEDAPTPSGMVLQDSEPADMDSATSANLQRLGGESPRDIYSSPYSPSDSEGNSLLRSPVNSKQSKQWPTKSGSSSSSSPTPEKPSRGFSRFFSSKGKSEY